MLTCAQNGCLLKNNLSLKPYDENECAKLADSEFENIEDSIVAASDF